jgi:hypothetical protein
LLGEHSFKLILGGVHWQVSHIERVAWWVLVSGVNWRVCRSREMRRILLETCVGSTVQRCCYRVRR